MSLAVNFWRGGKTFHFRSTPFERDFLFVLTENVPAQVLFSLLSIVVQMDIYKSCGFLKYSH